MKYVIHSRSERGFWNNKQGWVYGAAQATKFNAQEQLVFEHSLPLTSKKDAEWMVYCYDEETEVNLTVKSAGMIGIYP